jgi:hypothetical protein
LTDVGTYAKMVYEIFWQAQGSSMMVEQPMVNVVVVLSVLLIGIDKGAFDVGRVA